MKKSATVISILFALLFLVTKANCQYISGDSTAKIFPPDIKITFTRPVADKIRKHPDYIPASVKKLHLTSLRLEPVCKMSKNSPLFSKWDVSTVMQEFHLNFDQHKDDPAKVVQRIPIVRDIVAWYLAYPIPVD